MASSRSLSKISPFRSKQDTSVSRRCLVRPVRAYFPDNDRRSYYPLLNVNITLYVEGKIALFVITILCCCIFRDPHRYLSLLLSWEPDLSLWELSSHWLPPHSDPANNLSLNTRFVVGLLVLAPFNTLKLLFFRIYFLTQAREDCRVTKVRSFVIFVHSQV